MSVAPGSAVAPSGRRSRHHGRLRWGLVAILAVPAASPAQTTLTLAESFDRAAAGAYVNRAARAGLQAAEADRLSARRGMLPSIRFEAGFVRTTDPVGAFGTTLRQQRITTADFDPARLNFPAPLNNYTGALVLEQPLIMADAWLGARAAQRAAASAGSAAAWTDRSTQVDVVRAYYGVVLAAQRSATLDSATRAARAHVRQADLMLEAGLVTRSDVLLADVRAGQLEADLLQARGDSVLAHRQFAMLLGLPLEAGVSAKSGFPDDARAEALARSVMSLPAGDRADVDQARHGVSAASADVTRARAAMLPRLMSFVRHDLNSMARPYGGASNWTVGVMASWTPFTGATEIAGSRGASARQAGALARLDAVEAQASFDLEQSALALQTALARLAIARQAVTQGAEAHRIVNRKYAGGLATVVELLDASAAETQARLGLSAARHALLVATADRLRAIGGDPGRLSALDDTAPAPDGAGRPNSGF